MSSDRYDYIRDAAKESGAKHWEILPSPRNMFFITVRNIPEESRQDFIRRLSATGKIWTLTVRRHDNYITFYEKDIASFFLRRWWMGAVFFYRRRRRAVILATMLLFIATVLFIWYFC